MKKFVFFLIVFFSCAFTAKALVVNAMGSPDLVTGNDSGVNYQKVLQDYKDAVKEYEEKVNELTVSKKNTERNVLVILVISFLVIIVLLFSRISARKKEELIKELLSQRDIRLRSIIVGEERERSRVASQLHDGIGQQLSAAKLNISALQSYLKATDATDSLMLKNAVDLLDDSVKEVRNVSHSMIPNALVKSGLLAALHEIISKNGTGNKLKFNLEVVGEITRLEQTKEAVLFRVLQEVIGNIINHAKATEVGIQLIRHEKELSILIEDNGIGFDADRAIKNNNSIGLRSIQSRMDFLKGNVYFDSRPTKGTTVSIELPM